ncbi:hypothetical protein Tco_0090408 [Tanacetum coccineum]
MERAATIASSLEAEQESGNINRTQSMETLNESFPQGTDLVSGPRLVNTVRINLMLPVQVNVVEGDFINTSIKEESSGFEEIIDFLNASYVLYALTVNPTIYTTCIEQFRASAKAKILDDAKGIDCLPTAIIFIELERMSAKTTAWNEFSSTMASAIICLATNQTFNFSKYIFDNIVKHLEGGVKFLMYPRFVKVFLDKQVKGMTKHKEVYVTPFHTKKVFANMIRPGKGFYGRVTPLFPTIMIQALEDMGEDSTAPSYSHSTPIISQQSSSKPRKKKSRRKQRKDSGPTEPVTDEAHVSTHSYDLPQSEKVLDLEKAKTAQAKEIASLKKRVKKLEKRRKLRTPGLKRLRKVGSTSRVKSSNDVSLGDQEDASKQGRKIVDLDADAEEIKFEKVVEEPVVSVATTTKLIPISAADPVTTAGEVVTTTSASVEIPNELTLAQTLIEIKTAKPKYNTPIFT